MTAAKPHDRRVVIPRRPDLEPVEVDDPRDRGVGETPDRIVVMRSVRGDPLGWMHAGGRLDEAQYLAGRRWQQLYDRTQIGAVQALDTTKEPVDGGGGYGDHLSDNHRMAIRSLSLADAALADSWPGDHVRGKMRVKLVRDILGLHLFPTQAAALRGEYEESQVRDLVCEFMWCLDVLATSFDWQRR